MTASGYWRAGGWSGNCTNDALTTQETVKTGILNRRWQNRMGITLPVESTLIKARGDRSAASGPPGLLDGEKPFNGHGDGLLAGHYGGCHVSRGAHGERFH